MNTSNISLTQTNPISITNSGSDSSILSKANEFELTNNALLQTSLAIQAKSNDSLANAIRQMQFVLSKKDGLEAPTIDLLDAVDTMMSVLNSNYALNIKSEQNQLASSEKQGRIINNNKMVELKKYLAEQAKSLEAQKTQSKSDNASFGIGILCFLAGALATALTIMSGGALIPLIASVVGTVISAGMLGSSIADKVFQETKATEQDVFGNTRQKSGSLGRLFVLIAEAAFKSSNQDVSKMSESDKKKFSAMTEKLEQGVNVGMMVVSVAVAIVGLGVTFIPLLAQKLPMLANAAKEITKFTIKGYEGLAKAQVTFAKAITEACEFGLQLGSSSADAVSASYGIQLADTSFAMKQADNKLNYLEAINQQIQLFQNLAMQKMKRVSEDFESDTESITSLAKQIFEYQSRQINTI
ncbi:MAG: hypothetical protein RLZ92_1874 [Pseudomonadota bacterium]|jgi:hypothetical protein